LPNRLGVFVSRSASGFVRGLREVLERLIELPRNIKQACLLSLDMAFVALAMWSAVSLRWGT
jgi:hypothetical protein